jgi:hypothetical protein
MLSAFQRHRENKVACYYNPMVFKVVLVNCMGHFFLLVFCLQIMFPQFALFQILFLLLIAVEMQFFLSLLCPQGVNSTNFAGSGNPRSIISIGGREFHISQRATSWLWFTAL